MQDFNDWYNSTMSGTPGNTTFNVDDRANYGPSVYDPTTGGTQIISDNTPTYQLPDVNVTGYNTDPTMNSTSNDMGDTGIIPGYNIESYPTVTSGGSGGNGMGVLSGISSWLGNTLGITDPQAQASLIPYLGMALDQYRNSGQYQQLAQQEASMADPFGKFRNQYGVELSNLEKDPSQIANTPGYKFALNQALTGVGAREAAAGYGGTANEQNDMMTEASGLAQQTYNNTIKQLSDLAGAQFGPDAAANLFATGMTNSMLSRSNALGALAAPFGIQSQNLRTNGATGTQGGSLPNGGGLPNLNGVISGLGNSNQNEFNPNYSGPGVDTSGNSTPTQDPFISYDNNGNALDQNGDPFGMGGGE